MDVLYEGDRYNSKQLDCMFKIFEGDTNEKSRTRF